MDLSDQEKDGDELGKIFHWIKVRGFAYQKMKGDWKSLEESGTGGKKGDSTGEKRNLELEKTYFQEGILQEKFKHHLN